MNNNLTPLEQIQRAAGNRQPEELETLLRANPDIDLNESNMLKAPLFCAVMSNVPQLVELLLAHGADPNLHASDSKTPLHLAARWAGEEVVQLLLDHGANKNARDKKGNTPAEYAKAIIDSDIYSPDENTKNVRRSVAALLRPTD